MVNICQYNSPKQKLCGVLNNILQCKEVLILKGLSTAALGSVTRKGIGGL